MKGHHFCNSILLPTLSNHVKASACPRVPTGPHPPPPPLNPTGSAPPSSPRGHDGLTDKFPIQGGSTSGRLGTSDPIELDNVTLRPYGQFSDISSPEGADSNAMDLDISEDTSLYFNSEMSPDSSDITDSDDTVRYYYTDAETDHEDLGGTIYLNNPGGPSDL